MKPVSPSDMRPQYEYDELVTLLSTDFGRKPSKLPTTESGARRLLAKTAREAEKLAEMFNDLETVNKVVVACQTDDELNALIHEVQFRMWALERLICMLCGDPMPAPPELPAAEPPRPQRERLRGGYTAQVGTLVYVARALNGEVLYVGVTDNLFGRMNQHQRQSRWWDTMEQLSWEEFPTRAEALVQETKLIRRFAPPFNTVHNPDRRSPM